MTVGTKLGPYEILAPLGAGGMGEVWKARDTRLSRIVAIKQSQVRFSERFEREAHAIAALNHPHICQLYDVGPDYLVMEYVEGQPLKGPVPVSEALDLAGQILDALDTAHRKGITHRDLKPDNILLGKTGVKILDFGLAKVDRESESAEQVLTKPLTAEGTVLGTLHYMSPEQIEGQEADARSDIFAFGLVLYELITGQRAFEGKTRTSLVASILKDQPRPLSELQPLSPPALERVVATCLEKDPDKRWQSAREVKHALEWISAESPAAKAPVPSAPKRGWLWPAAAVAAVLAIAGLAYTFWPKHSAPAIATRFWVLPPEKGDFDAALAVSPDGHKLAFTTTGPDGGIWVRDLNALEARLLPGTQNPREIFWSPDSRYIGFAVGNQLKKIDISGGPPQTLWEGAGITGSGAWNKDGVIIFGGIPGPMRRISESGGVPVDLTPAIRGGVPAYTGIPSFLPDGRHFLYYFAGIGSSELSGVYSGSIDSKPDQQPTRPLIPRPTGARYVANADGSGGHLFFMTDGTLMAQPFDAGKLTLTGMPVPLAENVGIINALGWFSVSGSGVLAYRTGGRVGQFQLTWFDRQGKSLGIFGESNSDTSPVISPDGKRATVRDAGGVLRGDLWTLDFARGVRTRFTFRQSLGTPGIWSPDGSRIAFAAGTGRPDVAVYEKASSGAGEEKELFRKSGEILVPTGFSPDGRFLLCYNVLLPATGSGVWVLPLEGDRKPVQLLGSKFNEVDGAFSPDGRWIAYLSDESGRYEVYVRPFAASGATGGPALGEGKWQISKDGAATGSGVRWRADGKEVIFASLNNSPMAVEVSAKGAAFEAGIPKQLFEAPQGSGQWDVTPDGKKFLVRVLAGLQGARAPITVVSDWQAELKK